MIIFMLKSFDDRNLRNGRIGEKIKPFALLIVVEDER